MNPTTPQKPKIQTRDPCKFLRGFVAEKSNFNNVSAVPRGPLSTTPK